MKKLACLILLIILGTFPFAFAKQHNFACADYTQGKVFIAENDSVVWDFAAPLSNDLWILPNGNILFTTGHGVLELIRGKDTVFSYKSVSEIFACQRLKNGNTFICECDYGRLIEVQPNGKVVKEIKLLPDSSKGNHYYMRNVRKLDNGNYLVTHYGLQVAREYNPDG